MWANFGLIAFGLIAVFLIVSVLLSKGRDTPFVWLPAGRVQFHGRTYHDGRDVPSDRINGMVKAGHASWPDGDVFIRGYDPHWPYAYTVIIAQTPAGSHHYREYALSGGP